MLVLLQTVKLNKYKICVLVILRTHCIQSNSKGSLMGVVKPGGSQERDAFSPEHSNSVIIFINT